MKTLLLAVVMAALSGCATTYDTWQEAFAVYEEDGCRASLFNNKQASMCLSYASCLYCDSRFGLTSSWRNQSSRPSSYPRCVQDRYDYLAAAHMAQKQAVGQAYMNAGTELLKEPPTGPDYVCTPSPGIDAYRCVED